MALHEHVKIVWTLSQREIQHNEFLLKFWAYLKEQLYQKVDYQSQPPKPSEPECPKCRKKTSFEGEPKMERAIFLLLS